MDPVTQGVVGALFSQTASNRKTIAKAALIGTLGGMAPDLDSLIRSSTDPLLAIEYHRHFTHSFAFVPIGGLIVALLLFPLLAKRWSLRFLQIYLWATMGYATHALLDACTSYGTQVFWPFSNFRLSFDTMSIVDPLFTIPLLITVGLGCWLKSRGFVYAACCWAVCYLSLGSWQHDRAIEAGYQLAAQRGHSVERLHAKPSFANLIVWKIIYQSGDRYYVDAVRLWTGAPRFWEGDSTPAFDRQRDMPWLDPNSQQAKDIERFRWFSDDFIALSRSNPDTIVDMRYSLVPNTIDALWGIRLDRDADIEQHVDYVTARRERSRSSSVLWRMIKNSY